MLKINVSNPKAFDAAIRSVTKFSDLHGKFGTEITQSVMVESLSNELRLTATDLYTSVEYAVNSSEIKGEGEFCIKAKNLLALGEIIKDQSAIGFEQTENGVNLTLADAPRFSAKFDVLPTDEFPNLAEPETEAYCVGLTAEQVKILKAVTKYASAEKYRGGYDAVQFAVHLGTLYAYATDGTFIAYATLGKCADMPSFAIPVDRLKKAFQVANTPDLKKSGWLITVPSEDNEVIAIKIQETAVKFRAGEVFDGLKFIINHLSHDAENDDYLAFEPKPLTDGLKKVSKLFIRDKRVTNVLVIEGKDSRITMTPKPVKKFGYSHLSEHAADMQAEYVHTFSNTEVLNPTHRDFRVLVDAVKFQNMVKDLAISRPNFINVQCKREMNDAMVINGTLLDIGFLAMPAKL